jgi:hypothetical protein
MLQLFDQGRIHGDRHLLTIDEREMPERYRPLLRRLQQAAAEPQIADAMELEDEILEELQDIERMVERERERADQEQARANQEQARAEAEKTRAEQERAEKEQERAEKEQERTQKDQERAEKERLLAILKQAGLDPDQRI